MRIAVLGTGIMGAGMARSLLREGHEVTVWNRTGAKAAPLADDGAHVAESVSAAVSDAQAVVTMLFDRDATLAVTEELIGALGEGAVWIQAGTVGPEGARAIGKAAGRPILDAPVLGTKQPAEQGKLVVLVAGAHELVERARPVFDAIGSKTIEVGADVGMASSLKLAANAWIGLLTVGTAHSLAFAQQLGVDPALFLEAISGAPADSAYAQLKGKAMLTGELPLSFAVNGLLKDVELMVDTAEQSGFPRELLLSMHGLFARVSAEGHGSEDIAAVRYAFPE